MDSGVAVGSVKVAVGGTTVSIGTGGFVCISSVGELGTVVGVTVLPQAANKTEKTVKIIRCFIASNLISLTLKIQQIYTYFLTKMEKTSECKHTFFAILNLR